MYNFRLGDQHGLDDKSLYIVRYDPDSTNSNIAIMSNAGGVPLRK